MEPKKKLPLSFNNNIPRNLFQKAYSFTDNKKYSPKDRPKKVGDLMQSHKPINSFVYFHKIAINESKKEKNLKQKWEIKIDSKSEARLPVGYIDLSFDNPKNE